MKLISRQYLVLGLVLFAYPWVSQAQPVEAWIVQYEGDVFLKPAPGTAWMPVASELELNAGDSLRTGPGSQVTLLYRQGRRVVIEPEQHHRVAAGPAAEVPDWFVEALDWLYAQTPPQPPGIVRGNREEPPVLVYPRAGKVLSATPSVKWLAARPREADYRLRLVRDTHPVACLLEGDDVWERTVATDTVYHYADDAEALVPGRRYWIELERTTKEGFEDYGCFEVAPPQERQAMEQARAALQQLYPPEHSDDVTAELAYAMRLLQRSYFTDALLLIDAMARKQPGNPAVRRLRNEVFREAGPPLLISASAE